MGENERNTWLVQIVEQVLAQSLNDPHVTVENLKLAIEECIRPDTLKSTETILSVINAFDTPKIKHDLCKKKFLLTTLTPDLYPEAEYKSLLFRDRFELLWYRTLRHELFTPPRLGEKKENWIELVPIEYLLSDSRTGNIYVMGLLTQLTEGQYYLEDTGGTIKIDLQRAISFESVENIYEHHIRTSNAYNLLNSRIQLSGRFNHGGFHSNSQRRL